MNRSIPHRILRGMLCAVLVTASATSAAGAHDPIEYDVPAPWLENPPPNNMLKWKFASGVPTWLQASVNDAINYQEDPYDNSLWNSFQYNNSKAPNFTKDTNTTALVVYTGVTMSPCTGSMSWIMCAKFPGENNWSIQIRKLDTNPVTGAGGQNYRWEDQGTFSASGNLLADVRRNVLHEAIHHVLEGDHDPQGWPDSIMTVVTPYDGQSGYDSTHMQPCDHARLQLVWGMESADGSVADCFDHVSPQGSSGAGLETVLTLSKSATTVCLGTPVTLSGLLRIADWGTYGEMGDQVIGSRQVVIKRNGSTLSTLTTNATTGTYTTGVSYSSAVTYTFTGHFSQVGNGDIAPDNAPGVTVTWSSAC